MMRGFRNLILLLAAACGLVHPARAQYVLASPSSSLNSDTWSLDSSNMSGFRAAITNAAYFGTGGTVARSVTVTNLNAISPTVLAGVNGLMVPWWNNSQSAAYQTMVINAFKSGMDLWILADDASHNSIVTALGIGSSQANGSVSNGSAPFFSGAFGTATNTGTFGNFFQFNATDVTSLGGTIAGRNQNNEVTLAYWNRGAFSAGSGALILFSDVDMISNAYQQPYSPTLNANGILALNTMAFLAIPEPATYASLGLGLALLGLRHIRRRRQVQAATQR